MSETRTRIYDRCPACGNDTLVISDNNHLVCSWIGGRETPGCPDPGAASKLLKHGLDALLKAEPAPKAVEQAKNQFLTRWQGWAEGRSFNDDLNTLIAAVLLAAVRQPAPPSPSPVEEAKDRVRSAVTRLTAFTAGISKEVNAQAVTLEFEQSLDNLALQSSALKAAPSPTITWHDCPKCGEKTTYSQLIQAGGCSMCADDDAVFASEAAPSVEEATRFVDADGGYPKSSALSTASLTAGDSDNPKRALNTHGQTGTCLEHGSQLSSGEGQAGISPKASGQRDQGAERPAVNDVVSALQSSALKAAPEKPTEHGDSAWRLVKAGEVAPIHGGHGSWVETNHQAVIDCMGSAPPCIAGGCQLRNPIPPLPVTGEVEQALICEMWRRTGRNCKEFDNVIFAAAEAALRAAGEAAPVVEERPTLVTGSTSDGYHTFDELYDYRRAYNAALFNEWAAKGVYGVHKSWKHSDGELAFGGGWFIVVAQLPTGMISNHYKTEYWDLFRCDVREMSDPYDGHTPQIALQRLLDFVAVPSLPVTGEVEQASATSANLRTMIAENVKLLDDISALRRELAGSSEVQELESLKAWIDKAEVQVDFPSGLHDYAVNSILLVERIDQRLAALTPAQKGE